MNQTSGDSKFDIVFMSFGKEKEKGIEVKSAGEKDNIFKDNMVISVGNSEILADGTIKAETGAIIAKSAKYEQVKENRKKRITEFSIEKAKKEGKIKDFLKEKRRKQNSDSEMAL